MMTKSVGNNRKWLAVAGMIALATAMAVGLFGAGSAVALAAPGGTPGAPDGTGGPGGGSDTALAKFLQREQSALERFDHRYEVADRIATKVQAWIDKANADGKDTTGLQAGLAAFNARVTAAKALTDQAAALLAAHAGFDANGAVTDTAQARATVMAVREALRDAHKELVKAVPDLRHAINDQRKIDKGDKGQGDDEGTEQAHQGNGNGKGQGNGNGQGEDEGTETPTP